MDYNKVFEIVEKMSKIKAYRLKTDYLLKLISNYARCSKENKFEQEKIISNYIFTLFLDSIDKENKNEIYNINININEICSSIEKENPLWHITNYGAFKIKRVNDSYVVGDTIFRNHENGFELTESSSLDSIHFFEKNEWKLNVVNDYMCRKEDIINYEYKPKEGIPKEFTEELIDYIGFRRIEKEDLNEMNNKR